MASAIERFINLQIFLDDYCLRHFANPIKVLEAGCGYNSPVKFNIEHKIIGIDISENQLDRNERLDEKILGDIQTFPLINDEYEVIICWDVLEHLLNPRLALENFTRALKRNGIIILGIPNIFSLKGIITKYTPHFFHVFIYKNIYKSKRHTGRDDLGPFKTYLKYSISLPSLRKFALENKLSIIYLNTDDVASHLKYRNKTFYLIYKPIKYFFQSISFGKLGDSEMTLVLAKNV